MHGSDAEAIHSANGVAQLDLGFAARRQSVLNGVEEITLPTTIVKRDAFRKAVEADPQQQVSYKILAFALTSMDRNSDAIQVWQELAKVAPEDPDICSPLGALFLAEKRYGEALPRAACRPGSRP